MKMGAYCNSSDRLRYALLISLSVADLVVFKNESTDLRLPTSVSVMCNEGE